MPHKFLNLYSLLFWGGERQILWPPGIEPPTWRRGGGDFGGWGEKNFVPTQDRTTDLGVRVFLRGEGFLGLGKKNYAATRDRTTDHYYRPLKYWPNHPYYRSQKIEKIAEKKIVRHFFHKIKILFFFEFFSENVFKTLLRGLETTKKKYWIVFRKYTFLMKIEKNRWKKSCAKFFDKFKNFDFFRVFLRKCLKNSSKGTRNN